MAPPKPSSIKFLGGNEILNTLKSLKGNEGKGTKWRGAVEERTKLADGEKEGNGGGVTKKHRSVGSFFLFSSFFFLDATRIKMTSGENETGGGQG